MDALHLRQQVQDVVKLLASRDPTLFSGVQKHLAPDAVLEVPIHEAQGPQSIHDVVALHAAFTTDSAVGDVKWDEESKTATFNCKATYALPLSEAPWPLNNAGRVKIALQWEDVNIKLTPDNNHPAPTHSSEPSKYHIAKISKPARPPRHRLLAAPYHIFIFLVRLVAPYVITVLVTVMKFFQRNPLSNGIIRVGFSAVREIIQWMWALVLSHLSFASKARIGTVMQQSKTHTSVDVPQSPRKAPDVDLEEKPEVEAEEPKPQVTKMPEVKAEAENAVKPEPKIEFQTREQSNAESYAEAVIEEPEATVDEPVVESYADAVKEDTEATVEESNVENYADAVKEEPTAEVETYAEAVKEEPEAPIVDKVEIDKPLAVPAKPTTIKVDELTSSTASSSETASPAETNKSPTSNSNGHKNKNQKKKSHKKKPSKHNK